MDTIYTQAKEIAEDQKATIIRLDIHFNYFTQSYTGHLLLSNGNKYTILPPTEQCKDKQALEGKKETR